MKDNLSIPLLSLFVSFAFTTVSPAQSANPQGAQSSTAKEVKPDQREDVVRDVLMELGKALNGKDFAKAASYWNQNALFIDQSGEETTGRAALQERFAHRIAKNDQSQLTLHPEKITFPSPNVTIVVGSASRKFGSIDLPATRFSLVLLKQNDAWLIDEGTETTVEEIGAADHLNELDWLLGKWQVDKPDSAPTLQVEWGNGRNFIHAKLTVMKNGTQQIDNQVIGWDPRSKSIVSWHFDCNGGFGYGKWSKQSDRWIVDFAGVAADGTSTRATNVFVSANPNEFTWQSTNQSDDGVPIADTGILKVKRTQP